MLIKTLLAKKTLIAIASGVVIVSTVTYISVSTKSEPEVITMDQLRNDPELRKVQTKKCEAMLPMEAMQHPVCQMIGQAEKQERRKGDRDYTDRGEPVDIPDKLPGRP